MNWVLLTILVIILFLVIIMFTKLKIIIDYYHGQDNDHLKLKFIALFGLVQYKLDVPMIKVDKESKSIVVKEKVETGPDEKKKTEDTKRFTAEDLLNSLKDTKELLEHVVGLYKIARNFMNKVIVTEIKWNTVVGVGDAALTGMISGAFWAVKGSLIGFISHHMRMRKIPEIMITPHFNGAISQTSFTCMIKFRIGHAIFAGIKLIKFWKGGRPHFRTKPLSVLSANKTKSL